MLLLEKVFSIINESGLQYCIQNKYEMMPEEIPSDIDMMYKDASEEFLDKLVKTIAKQTGLLVTQKICQGYYEFTYILSYKCPKQRFQLQLDFYRAISRRGYLNIMPAEDMIENRRYYKCFFVPGYYDELRYMWIRRTIKRDLNREHIRIAKGLLQLNRKEYALKLEQDFGKEVALLIIEIIDGEDTSLFYNNFEKFNAAAKRISHRNSTLQIKMNYLKFILFTIIPKRILHPCGISIAFLSPDGGGKSTIISNVSNTVIGSFYGLCSFYFRPRLFKNIGSYDLIHPKSEDKVNVNPQGKELNNPLKSLIRFVYYNMDFLIGTYLKILPRKIKKNLIIFDRYYYDYFADMKRYQYNLPKFLPRIFYWMIPKPDLVFILYAEPEILYARKQELSLEEIRRQSKEYLKLSKKGDRFRIIDVSNNIEQVTDNVTEQIMQYMSDYTDKIMY